MTEAEAVRARLLDCAPVTALVGQRVYKDVLPQKPTLPCVRVQRISQVRPWHLRGPVGVNVSRVQADSIALTKADAEAVDAAIVGDGLGPDASGLVGWSGALGSPAFEVLFVEPETVRDDYEAEELRQFRVSRDVLVHWRT